MTSLNTFFSKGWENVLFQLGSERVKKEAAVERQNSFPQFAFCFFQKLSFTYQHPGLTADISRMVQYKYTLLDTYTDYLVTHSQPAISLGSPALDNLGDVDTIITIDMLVAAPTGNAEPKTCNIAG